MGTPSETSFSAVNVKSKLLFIFSILCVFILALAGVAWITLNKTENTLNRFQQDTFSDISKSIDLANKSTQLTFSASNILSISNQKMLIDESNALLERFDNIYQQSNQIDSLKNERASLEAILLVLKSQITLLTNNTQQRISLEQSNIAKNENPIQTLQEKNQILLNEIQKNSQQLKYFINLSLENAEKSVSNEINKALQDAAASKTAIFVVTILLIIASLVGILVVIELTNNLGSVTNAMNLLIEGNKSQKIPAVNRHDEIGFLARAFNVFQENSLAIDRLAADLQEQARLLETVFNNINDGLSVFDREEKLVKWNAQYLQIFSIESENIYSGMSIEQVAVLLSKTPHENRSLDGQLLNIKDINTQRQHYPQRFIRYYTNGKVIEFRSRPMPGGGFVTLYSDLTESKALEAQFQQAQKMETIGQLMGGLAHDFNNLLMAIIGNLELLEYYLRNDKQQKDYTHRALAAADRGVHLTQRLLAFACKQRLDPEPTNVDQLIEGIFDLIEYSINPRINLDLKLNNTHWQANIDPAQLENALLNLSLNSSSAMPRGGTLTFLTEKLPNHKLYGEIKDCIAICVKDTGTGIPEEVLQRVFEPFYSTKHKGQGSGLGLSMVYGFTKQSGGDIKITSSTSGTMVRVIIPRLADDEVQLQPTPQQTKLTSNVDIYDEQPLLLVEDDLQVQEVTRKMLEQMGYKVKTAVSGESGLEILKSFVEIQLIISDIDLPGNINGIEFLQKAKLVRPSLRGILMSALPQSQLVSQIGMEESESILAKPFRKIDLANAIDQLTK